MNKKTVFEKFYSFFGFWKYYMYKGQNKYKVIYWCCFPFWYIRKFDLFKIKVKSEQNVGKYL